MLFLLLDVTAFVVWQVLPLAFHAVLLPLAFAQALDHGLRITYVWVAFYGFAAALSVADWIPRPLRAVGGAGLRLLIPAVAALPLLEWVRLVDLSEWVLPLLDAAASAAVGTALASSAPWLAAAEAVATVVVIKRMGSALKALDDGAAKGVTAMLLIAGYIASCATLYFAAATEGAPVEWIVGAAVAVHLLIVAIPRVSSPGDRDVPAAEGFLLLAYVAYCVAQATWGVPAVAAAAPADGWRAVKAAASANLPASLKWLHLVRADRLLAIAAGVGAYASALRHLFPASELAALAYRTFALSAAATCIAKAGASGDDEYLAAAVESDDDSEADRRGRKACRRRIAAEAADARGRPLLAQTVAGVFGLARPFLILYYAQTLMVFFGDAADWSIDGQGRWVSLITGVSTYALLLIAHALVD